MTTSPVRAWGAAKERWTVLAVVWTALVVTILLVLRLTYGT